MNLSSKYLSFFVLLLHSILIIPCFAANDPPPPSPDPTPTPDPNDCCPDDQTVVAELTGSIPGFDGELTIGEMNIDLGDERCVRWNEDPNDPGYMNITIEATGGDADPCSGWFDVFPDGFSHDNDLEVEFGGDLPGGQDDDDQWKFNARIPKPTGDGCEQYTLSATLTDHPNDECFASDEPVEDSITITVYLPLELVSVSLEAVIECPYIYTRANPFVHDYYNGGRKVFQTATARIESAGAQDQAWKEYLDGTDSQSLNDVYRSGVNQYYGGPTEGWDASNFNSEEEFDCWWCVDGTPITSPDCSKTAQPDKDTYIQFNRGGSDKISLYFHMIGTNPCALIKAKIDANITVHLRNTGCSTDGCPKHTQYKVTGNHDGFPSYILKINGTEVYHFDSCAKGQGPNSLFGTGEWSIEDVKPELLEWRDVP